jgi:hypothetical protein
VANELIAGIGIFKSLYDSAKALKDINDATVRNGAVIELQEKILTAQEAQSSLIDRIRYLEEKIRDFETWESEKKRYELKSIGPSVFAYMLKPAMRGGEPPHWICTNCFSKRQTSIIQWGMMKGLGMRNLCPSCETVINPDAGAFGANGQPKWMD